MIRSLSLSSFVLLLSACSGVPAPLVDGHLSTAGEHHLQMLRAASEDPPRVDPVTPLQMETWEDHYDAMRQAVEVSR